MYVELQFNETFKGFTVSHARPLKPSAKLGEWKEKGEKIERLFFFMKKNVVYREEAWLGG